MRTKAIIVASVGISLAIISTLFILLSDFGCNRGNVGSAGPVGPPGPMGDIGKPNQVVFAPSTDLVARDLTVGTGHTQPSFTGTLLPDSGEGYMSSEWVVSVLGTGTVNLNFTIMNNDTILTLTPGNTITQPVVLVANVRQEINVQIYIWKTDTRNFTVAFNGQPTVYVGFITDYDTANIAVRLQVDNASGYNRSNSVRVYQKTKVDEIWCN